MTVQNTYDTEKVYKDGLEPGIAGHINYLFMYFFSEKGYLILNPTTLRQRLSSIACLDKNTEHVFLITVYFCDSLESPILRGGVG